MMSHLGQGGGQQDGRQQDQSALNGSGHRGSPVGTSVYGPAPNVDGEGGLNLSQLVGFDLPRGPVQE